MPRHASWFSAVSLSLLLLGSAPAHASELIDFGTGSAGPGGWLSYDGQGGALTGSHILLGVLTAVGTPDNSGVHQANGLAPCLTVLCAELSFTTGALSSYSNGVYSFQQGGSFTIAGGISGTGVTSQPLVWGNFTSESVLDGGQLKLFAATGGDHVSADLLKYLGIADGTSFDFVGSVIGLNLGFSGPGGGFNALAVSSDISSVATPEPASLALMLLGTCMVGVRTLRRRVANASSPIV
jgi:hypothetical protein